ncbi:MAG TPA: hypothetical protein VFK89_06220 [Actinomycetota bacterium]|nr:hypothetical protein [Actinomycetota bacterium]
MRGRGIAAILLVVVAATMPPAGAKPKPKAAPVSLYLHGSSPVGEIDGMQNWSNIITGEPLTFLPMTPEKPSSSTDKSFGIGPQGDDQCSGNPVLPTWDAKVQGTIKGHMKLRVTLLSYPAPIHIRVFADVDELSCDLDYDNPVVEKELSPDPGLNDYTIDLGDATTHISHRLILMISPNLAGAGADGRVIYDSTAHPSRLEFSCVPDKGTAGCAAP